MRRGWYNQSWRHSLAAKGISTSPRKSYAKSDWRKYRTSFVDVGTDYGTINMGNDATYKKFRKAYLDAKESGQESFMWEGQEILTNYAKYVLQYADMLREQSGRRTSFAEKDMFEVFQSADEKTGMSEQLKNETIAQKMEEVKSELDRAVEANVLDRSKKLEFLKNDFANEVKLYNEGTINDTQFQDSVDMKFKSFVTLNQTHSNAWDKMATDGGKKNDVSSVFGWSADDGTGSIHAFDWAKDGSEQKGE